MFQEVASGNNSSNLFVSFPIDLTLCIKLNRGAGVLGGIIRIVY